MASFASNLLTNNINFGYYGSFGTLTPGTDIAYSIAYIDGKQTGNLSIGGTGFTYSGGKVTGGTVTFIADLQDVSGQTDPSVVYYMDGVSVAATDLMTQVNSKSTTANLDFTKTLFSGRDTIQGGVGDQSLYGAALDDLILPASGNDVVWGGEGYNVAQYNAPRSALTSVTINSPTQVTISGDVTTIGNDVLNNIYQINLSDGQLVYNISFAPVDQTIYRMYGAAFNRTPDQSGFTYWVGANDKGASVVSIANAFVTSPEFIKTYGNTTNTQYVDLLYQNVLGRQPDPAGEKFWVDKLDSGQATRATLLIGFADSPEEVKKMAPNIDNGYWLV